MLNNIARIQRALTQAHLDAILLTDENDRRFATGFPSSDGAVIVTVHQAFFITDARYIEAARAALTGIAQVLLCSREAPMRTLVQGILREANVQILGGEEQTTSYAEFTAYEQLFGLKLQPAQNLIRNLRAAKQPEELAMMYQAQQITDETFAQICTVIRPGMTEREIAAGSSTACCVSAQRARALTPSCSPARTRACPTACPATGAWPQATL